MVLGRVADDEDNYPGLGTYSFLSVFTVPVRTVIMQRDMYEEKHSSSGFKLQRPNLVFNKGEMVQNLLLTGILDLLPRIPGQMSMMHNCGVAIKNINIATTPSYNG